MNCLSRVAAAVFSSPRRKPGNSKNALLCFPVIVSPGLRRGLAKCRRYAAKAIHSRGVKI
jgi:hypothetical protein